MSKDFSVEKFRGQPCQQVLALRFGRPEDIPALDDLQRRVLAGMEQPEWYVPSTRQEMASQMEKGLFLCLWAWEEAVAYLSLVCPGGESGNYGWDLGLPSDQIPLWANVDSVVVAPEYRGNGIQRRLLRLDPQNDTIETLTTWDAYGGQLWGTWGDALLITRRVLSPACPVQPEYAFYRIDNFNDMKPFLTEMLYALDPATGRETLLAEGPVYTFGPRQKLAGDALWWADGTQLLRQPLGTDAPQTVADLPQTMWVEQVFDADVFLCAQQGDKTVQYVYHLADGTLEETPAEVLCQIGEGEYLVKAGDGVAVMG